MAKGDGGKAARKAAGRRRPGGPAADGAASPAVRPGRILRWCLLLNLPVLALAAWCLVRFHAWRPVLRHAWHLGDALNLARAVGGAALIALVITVLLPVTRWIRTYPADRFVRGNRVVWYVPLLLSMPVWLLLCAVGIPVAAGLGAYSAWIGLSGLGLVERTQGWWGG